MSQPPSICPCCEGRGIRVFYRAEGVPVNSVLQIATRKEALEFPTGTIALGFCPSCGFIYNTAFDAGLLEYSERYNPTQAYSETFNRWHTALADELIERYGLREKRIIEIGCGKGEFLKLLCERGQNRGLGFDPAYEPSPETASARVQFVTDFYSEKYGSHKADFVCCKMTLEHIRPAAEFVTTVRRAVGDAFDTVVFFQVPDVRRILEEFAYWDIYYEHCSYYSLGSLARLFRRVGFDVVDLFREYDAQYLMIAARPSSAEATGPLDLERDLGETAALVDRFARELPPALERWRSVVAGYKDRKERVVIWGSGSKGVAFLTTLGLYDGIDYVVDINPNRHGHFMAKTGQEIVGPEFLKQYRPDAVIIMNPIYKTEITAELARLGLDPEVMTT